MTNAKSFSIVFNRNALWDSLNAFAATNRPLVLRRNALPFLFRNTSQKPLAYGGGYLLSGQYLAVQPSGAYHVTNPALHALGGCWRGFSFNQLSGEEVMTLASNEGASWTSPGLADEARRAVEALNPSMAENTLKPIGWCPSISAISAFQMEDAFKGSAIRQPWGKEPRSPWALQPLDPEKQLLVLVLGKDTDVYGNDKLPDMKDWRPLLDVPHFAATEAGTLDMIESLPQVPLRAVKAAILPAAKK